MELSKKEKEVFERRQKRYGDFINAHENLGLIWTALIQNHFRIILPRPIPSHLVLLMMAGSKLNRAVAEEDLLDFDNYDDNKIYIEMAKKAREVYDATKKSEILGESVP